MTEAGSRVIIDSLLSEVGWILRDSDGNRNVDFEEVDPQLLESSRRHLLKAHPWDFQKRFT